MTFRRNQDQTARYDSESANREGAGTGRRQPGRKPVYQRGYQHGRQSNYRSDARQSASDGWARTQTAQMAEPLDYPRFGRRDPAGFASIKGTEDWEDPEDWKGHGNAAGSVSSVGSEDYEDFEPLDEPLEPFEPFADYPEPDYPDSDYPDQEPALAEPAPFVGGFPDSRIAPDERLLVDVHPQRTTMFYPLMESILVSGLLWAFIGLIDGGAGPFVTGGYAGLRQIVVVLWICALLWFLIRPAIGWWKRRLAVTNYRIVVKYNRKDIVEIPLREVAAISRDGSTITIRSYHYAPVVIENVSKARRVTRIIERRMRHYS